MISIAASSSSYACPMAVSLSRVVSGSFSGQGFCGNLDALILIRRFMHTINTITPALLSYSDDTPIYDH